MTSIQSFGASLLDPNVRAEQVKSQQSVEDIMNNTPAPVQEQAPDTFTKEGEQPAKAKRGGFNWLKIGGFTIAALGLFFFGRMGWLGKHIQKWFGGKPSMSKINENIENKMAEYLNIGEGGKVKIKTNDDGTKVLRAEFSSGNIQEYSIVEGENLVKLKGRFQDCELNEEYITFSKSSGSPVARVNLKRNDAGKVEEFQSYKGADVLNNDFNEDVGLYKYFVKSSPKRRFLGLFGPKQVKSSLNVYTNPKTGKPYVIESKTVYRDNKPVYEKQIREGLERIIYFDKQNGKISKIVTTAQDGKKVIENFKSVLNGDGKLVTARVSIVDSKGNPAVPIAWNV